ncbi:DUF3105 domain-containing protein [Agromyces aerolatus]|uniref:DUF3105 domain-containing protein n=1 Tax=Agromyces sp. LY-1074 TaxID=3074080 RepID=UPI00285708FC|nr:MULTISPECIES: DUF3105 domain-containing protein [unclassified Agromyces]MDR5699507.1 DUF3105 domain-containing protein [Agromyces sp. LY-1074]MDR5705803.1 DUF3105 domain-containing protein [Agromyces sp. LY-1358]
MSATPRQTGSDKPLSTKQQRAAERERKLEAFRKKEARSKRNRKLGLIGAIVGVVAIAGLLVASIVFAPRPATYAGGGTGTGADIEGVELFENTSNHVTTPVDYAQTPPAGGEHNPAWLNCGVYTEPVPNENAVHSLEHGALWVTYDPSLSEEELATLRSKLPSSYVILSPFEDLPSPIVVSGWNSQLQVDEADDPRIEAFFEEFWKSNLVPEPGALCSGGVDGPGKA